MAEEAIITPDSEVKDVKEGSVAAEVEKVKPETTDDKTAPETVPLRVYLDLKEDLKTLKHEIKQSKESVKDKVEVQGLEELSSKYPDVNQDFIKDLLNSATSQATEKLDKKFGSIIEKQEEEKKQAAFDVAFDNLFSKTLNDNPDLPKNIDKEAIKALSLTPKYINVPLADILLKMYPSVESGKSSSENEMRSGADRVDDIVSFDKITDEQKKAIMADPKSRTKYFSWLDTQTR